MGVPGPRWRPTSSPERPSDSGYASVTLVQVKYVASRELLGPIGHAVYLDFHSGEGKSSNDCSPGRLLCPKNSAYTSFIAAKSLPSAMKTPHRRHLPAKILRPREFA